MNPKLSIITPSVRESGLDIVRDAILSQSYTDWEWLVCSPFEVEDAIYIHDGFKNGFWSLNRAYNALLKRASGDIIVSWQDFIWTAPDTLERFVYDVEQTGGFVSGVGDQYQRLGEYGKPEVKIWNDPRKTDKYGSFYECLPNDVEFNMAAFPKKAAFEVGGFDEKLDFLGFGGDQLQFMERVDALGYKSYIDQTIESFTLRHDRHAFGGEDNWNSNHVLFNGKYDDRKEELKRNGSWPSLTYLL